MSADIDKKVQDILEKNTIVALKPLLVELFGKIEKLEKELELAKGSQKEAISFASILNQQSKNDKNGNKLNLL